MTDPLKALQAEVSRLQASHNRLRDTFKKMGPLFCRCKEQSDARKLWDPCDVCRALEGLEEPNDP